MSSYVFPPPAQPALAVADSDACFPIRRIFCVGRNYAAHAAEMGNTVDREAPFYFTKSAHAVLPSGQEMPYPPGTADLHHEVELVVAIGAGGAGIDKDDALSHVFGFGLGLDMTRRDLQAAAKERRRPWDTGKDFDNSAILAPLTIGASVPEGEISLSVNGNLRQTGQIADMVWSVTEIIAHLSTLYTLQAGDMIMTGTPAGVGAVSPGDRLVGKLAGLDHVEVTISP